ncbi:MAG: sugar phosphate isomerase/epimerase [Clostridiales bacterium]|nr:sugar phosphate isomerase/epimerase [Clostridiales bacterium]
MIDLYLSTIGTDAAALAREYGLGIEIAEFSYAVNMDTDFPHWDEIVRANIAGIERRIFHAPFNDLCPAALDPLVLEVTRRRFAQAYKLMQGYGIHKMVVHSGYLPRMHYKSWFAAHSVDFWREFLSGKPPDFLLALENVMEEDPDMLLEIVEKTGDPRFQLCLDIGHAGAYFSHKPVSHWIETAAPYLGHVHVHNNYHEVDTHNEPGDGLIDMKAALTRIAELRPNVTYTLETQNMIASVEWMKSNGFIEPGRGSAEK